MTTFCPPPAVTICDPIQPGQLEAVCRCGPTIICQAPNYPVCNAQACACAAPTCTVAVSYQVNAPSTARIVSGPEGYCDAAGLELAIAILVTKLLGAP